DKVDAEIPAPSAGVLAEIKVQEGQTVPVQTLVAVIETEAGAAAPAPGAAPAPAAPKPPPVPPAAAKPAAEPAPPASAPVRPAAPPSGGDGVESAEERLRKKSTPLVRKIAAEHQVDIATIPGTGFAGRVTKTDILGFIERGVPAPVSRPA